MPIPVTLNLIRLLENHLVGNRRTKIPPYLQVLMALRFYAVESYQLGLGQDFKHPASQATISRCIDRVTNLLVKLSDEFIRLPETKEERQRISRG